jgi:hypothetical protein
MTAYVVVTERGTELFRSTDSGEAFSYRAAWNLERVSWEQPPVCQVYEDDGPGSGPMRLVDRVAMLHEVVGPPVPADSQPCDDPFTDVSKIEQPF